MPSFWLEESTKIASWRRLGASGARLGGLLGRLGRVLERPGLMWERPVAVLVRLGASGARLQTSRARSDGNYGTLPAGHSDDRRSAVPRGSPIIKTKNTYIEHLHTERLPTERYLQRVSVESECRE